MAKVGTFYGHEEMGAKTAANILRRLRFPETEVEAIATCIREHLRPPLDPSDKALRNYVAAVGEVWEDALAAKYGDLSAHNLPKDFDARKWYDTIRARILALPKEMVGFEESKLAVKGGMIVAAFKVIGKDVGRYKKHAAQAVIDGIVPNEEEALMKFLVSEREAGRL